jgi:hypothetical protein
MEQNTFDKLPLEEQHRIILSRHFGNRELALGPQSSRLVEIFAITDRLGFQDTDEMRELMAKINADGSGGFDEYIQYQQLAEARNEGTPDYLPRLALNLRMAGFKLLYDEIDAFYEDLEAISDEAYGVGEIDIFNKLQGMISSRS